MRSDSDIEKLNLWSSSKRKLTMTLKAIGIRGEN